MKISHFNTVILEKPSNKISKETYLDLKFKEVDEKFINDQTKRIEYNFDLNMRYFNSLDYDKFNSYLDKFTKKYGFKEVIDLEKYKGKTGLYILVLDNYKQVYIGMSNSGICEEIKSHWSRRKAPDRLIFGQAFNSVLSIDSFGALDTTRIYVKTNVETYSAENKYVELFDNKYLLNRTMGGIGSIDTYTNDSLSARLAVVGNAKRRDFSPFIDEKELYEKCNGYDIMMYESKKKQNS